MLQTSRQGQQGNRILLVEDDSEIARIIRDHLRREGYEVTWASTGLEGWTDFEQDEYDLAVVDLMLPEMDGFTLCRNIRLKSDIPLLIMSARDGDEHKVKGLGLGADDYITKPFSLTELSARISSHLRRYRRYLRPGESEAQQQEYSYRQGLLINVETKQITLHGQEVHLTAKEKELLLLLASHPQRTFTKRELYEHVWKQMDSEANNTVTVHIKGLRDKLGESTRTPKFIQTVWGEGYRFVGERQE